jgi:hypothetical protein
MIEMAVGHCLVFEFMVYLGWRVAGGGLAVL